MVVRDLEVDLDRRAERLTERALGLADGLVEDVAAQLGLSTADQEALRREVQDGIVITRSPGVDLEQYRRFLNDVSEDLTGLACSTLMLALEDLFSITMPLSSLRGRAR